MTEIEASAQKGTDAVEKAEKALADLQASTDEGKAAIVELAKALDDPDLAGQLIKTKDKLAEMIVQAERAYKALQEVPAELNAGLAEFRKGVAAVPAKFAKAEQELTTASKAAESASSSQLKAALAAAKKGDTKLLDDFVKTEGAVIEAADQRVTDCDESGGTEGARVRVVMATSRERVKADYKEAQAELAKSGTIKAGGA